MLKGAGIMKSLQKFPTKKIVLAGILCTLAIIAFVIEGLFPPLFIAGARMGISNVFILLAMLFLGNTYAFIILTIKVVLGSLFAGNVSAVMYSLPAGFISLSIEALLMLGVKKISIVAVSIAGAIVNTTIQNLTFCLITNSVEYLSYLPYLVLIALLAGLTVGLTVYLTTKFLPDNLIKKFTN